MYKGSGQEKGRVGLWATTTSGQRRGGETRLEGLTMPDSAYLLLASPQMAVMLRKPVFSWNPRMATSSLPILQCGSDKRM